MHRYIPSIFIVYIQSTHAWIDGWTNRWIYIVSTCIIVYLPYTIHIHKIHNRLHSILPIYISSMDTRDTYKAHMHEWRERQTDGYI